jgi:hypothetical protein
MPPWTEIITIVAVLCVAIVVCDWLSRRQSKHSFAHESEEFPSLKEGQTILAVVDKKRRLYFFIGKDREQDVQEYEEDVK